MKRFFEGLSHSLIPACAIMITAGAAADTGRIEINQLLSCRDALPMTIRASPSKSGIPVLTF